MCFDSLYNIFLKHSWKYPIFSSIRIPFTSLHLSLSNSCFLEIPDFLLTSNSLHFTSLHVTSLHLSLSSSSFLEIPDFLLTSNSLHFTYHFPTPVFLEIPDFLPTSNSLHFTSLITFQLLFFGNTRFPSHYEFPSLHLSLSNSCFLEIPDFLLTSNSLHFTSLHFTYHFPTPVFWKHPISSSLRIPLTSLHLSLSNSCFFGNTRFPPHFEFPSLHFTSLITFQLLFFGDTRFPPHFEFP